MGGTAHGVLGTRVYAMRGLVMDLARDVAIVSLPLRFAMIADRAEVALERVEAEQPLREDDRRALTNAMTFLADALKGQEIQSKRLGGYQPLAICAYEVAQDASKKANVQTADFLDHFQGQLRSLLEQQPIATPSEARQFFHHLAEWCLEQDVSEFERVELDAGRGT